MIKSWAKFVIALLVITNLLFIATSIFYKSKIDNQVFKVYSFEGESNDIRLSNGIIIISSAKQIVNGGQIQYLGEKLENIIFYSKTISIDGKTILSNSVSNSGEIPGMTFPNEILLNRDVGGISAKKLFSDKDINAIKDSLYFNLYCVTGDNKPKNYTIKLKVTEIL